MVLGIRHVRKPPYIYIQVLPKLYLASWLRTRRFSELRPFGATNHWKNTVLRDFPTFSHTWVFFLLRLFFDFCFFSSSSLTLPISAFHLSILSEVWLLNFLRIFYIIYIYIYIFGWPEVAPLNQADKGVLCGLWGFITTKRNRIYKNFLWNTIERLY